MPSTDALQISPADSDQALTPEQKRFNTLIRQIGKARATLRAWQDNIPLYVQAHAREHPPLHAQLRELHRERLFALDAAYDRHSWNPRQRETLSDLVCEAASEMLQAGIDDPDVKALFSKHAGQDVEALHADKLREMKAAFEAQTGLDLGDDDIGSTSELMKRIQQGMAQRAQATAGQADAQAAEAGAAAGPEKAGARSRKSAAEQRREAEAQGATQSARDVFRKLASALHPDREPDADLRAVKTGLMQRANQAYAADDLLGLLELQMEIEQIDDAGKLLIGGGGNGVDGGMQLKHYIQLLARQLDKLKTEIRELETGFRDDFRLDHGKALNPLDLQMELEFQTRHLRILQSKIRLEIDLLDDIAATKQWLKIQRQLSS